MESDAGACGMREGLELRKHGRTAHLRFARGIGRLERVITLNGIRRSGNHAAVNWILPHLRGVTCYLHDFHYTETVRVAEHFIYHDSRVHRLQAVSQLVTSERAIRPYSNVVADNLIIGAENRDISKSNSFLAEYGITADRQDEVLILRDYRNNAASLSRRESLLSKNEFRRLWRLYAEEFSGKTDYLGDAVAWSFNQWFVDVEYRKNLAAQLGLEFTDAGLNEVSPAADGSSFDSTAFQGNAQAMRVLERYKDVSIEIDGALDRLSEGIFGAY